MADVSDEELKSVGLTREDFADDENAVFGLFPENVLSFTVFERMSTQWRVGFGGATGLDYNVLFELFRVMKVPAGRRSAVLDDVRLMEGAVLKQFADRESSSK